jgi:hypothetical protein
MAREGILLNWQAIGTSETRDRQGGFFPSQLAHTLCLLAAVALIVANVGACLAADEPSAADSPLRAALVGRHVKVELRKGKPLEDVIVQEVRLGKISGTVAGLRLQKPSAQTPTLWGAGAIARVLLDGKPVLVFDETTKTLISPDAPRPSAVHKASENGEAKTVASSTESPKSSTDSPKSKSKTSARKKKSSLKNDAGKTKSNVDWFYTEEELAARATPATRAAYFEKTGVLLWEEITDEVYEKELTSRKEYLQKVAAAFSSVRLRLYETQYYLFLSDFPPQVANEYTSCLDKMHEQLCHAYGIKNKDGVWLGKLPVIAFTNGLAFVQFEQAFFNLTVDPSKIQGLSHNSPTGDVVVSCHAGRDPNYFAAVLVHEATHGFNHRFKSAIQYPNWLDEGMADWTAMNVVHNNRLVVQKIKVGVAKAKQQRNLGGNFFTAQNIEAWQYGIASSMIDFMLKSDPKAFRNLLVGIKSGEKWQDALRKYYHVTPEQLTAAYGLSMGIPYLQP